MHLRLPLLFLLITVMIDSMGIGLVMPVMPDLIIALDGGDLSHAATWGGALVAVFAIMQFLFGPTVGSLSDRFGRRPVLLVSMSAMALDYMILGVANAMWLLVVGRIIGGVTSATQSTANAYMADISDKDHKAQNFGLIGAAFGLGFILGPLLGGFLSEFGARTPFFAAAGLAAANTIFGALILPESLTDKNRRAFSWHRANPLGAFRHIRKIPGLSRLLVVYFFFNVAFFVYPNVWAYFAEERFDWDASMIGVSLAVFGASMAIMQGGAIRLIIPKLGERKTVILGLLANILAFVVYSLAYQGWQVFAFAPLTSIGVITGPALQGIMSKTADDNQQGELQGVLTSISAIGIIISPLIMNGTFSYFTRAGSPVYFAGAPFVLAALLVMASLLVFMRHTKKHATAPKST